MPSILMKRGNSDTAISREGRQGQREETKNRAIEETKRGLEKISPTPPPIPHSPALIGTNPGF